MPSASDLDRIRGILGDRYEVISPVGSGGMASVYIARHRRHGGLVAVKVLAEELAEVPELVERFIQEARTAATLDGHPNVISVFDIGDLNGTYYLLMPFLVGEDLSKYLKRNGKLSPNDAANVMAQTLHGLNWAHQKGVVHRDIKPSNLYLDQNGRIVVVDFGIAKLRDFPSLQTKANVRLGTTFYMCPEQIRGEACDGRSDLYTLGVVFYELLTGKRPFVGTTEHEVLIGHLEKPVPDMGALDPQIPKPYIDIVYKLLEKSPRDRYQSAAEVIAELEKLGQYGVPAKIRPQIDQTIGEAKPAPPPASAHPERTLPPTEASHNVAPAGQPQGIVMKTRVDPIPAPHPTERAVGVPGVPPGAASANGKNKLLLPLGIAGAVLVLAAAGWFFLSGQKDKTAAPTKTVAEGPVKAGPAAVIEDRNHKKMGLIPAGAFIFGDDSKESPNPKKTVTLPPFYLDLTEVTVKEYKAFCAATGRKMPEAQGADDLPVTDVSWDDAVAYAGWLGKRLPTEEEWEKAARGANGQVFPWGNAAWERGADGPPDKLVAVESYPDRRSPYGAFNMAGNAAEWTVSAFPDDKKDKRYIEDFKNLLKGKPISQNWYVIKGGYFGPNAPLDFFFRAYMRRPWPENVPSAVVGFRCAKDL